MITTKYPELEINHFDEAGEIDARLYVSNGNLVMLGDRKACDKAKAMLAELFLPKVEAKQ